MIIAQYSGKSSENTQILKLTDFFEATTEAWPYSFGKQHLTVTVTNLRIALAPLSRSRPFRVLALRTRQGPNG